MSAAARLWAAGELHRGLISYAGPAGLLWLKLSLFFYIPFCPAFHNKPPYSNTRESKQIKLPESVFTLSKFTWGSYTQIKSFSSPDPDIEAACLNKRGHTANFSPHTTVLLFLTSKKALLCSCAEFLWIKTLILLVIGAFNKQASLLIILCSSKCCIKLKMSLRTFTPSAVLGKQQQYRKSDKRINCGANPAPKFFFFHQAASKASDMCSLMGRRGKPKVVCLKEYLTSLSPLSAAIRAKVVAKKLLTDGPFGTLRYTVKQMKVRGSTWSTTFCVFGYLVFSLGWFVSESSSHIDVALLI